MIKILSKKNIAYGAAALVVALLFLFQHVEISYGNPSVIQAPASCMSATATTTENFMTPGTGTTTLPCDLAGGSNEPTVSSAVLALQLTGSSSPTTRFSIAIECSNDNIQFYQNCGSTGTTSTMFTYAYASSTGLGGSPAKSLPGQYDGYPINTIAIQFTTPMRYARAVVSVLGANGSVWMQFIKQKELR